MENAQNETTFLPVSVRYHGNGLRRRQIAAESGDDSRFAAVYILQEDPVAIGRQISVFETEFADFFTAYGRIIFRPSPADVSGAKIIQFAKLHEFVINGKVGFAAEQMYFMITPVARPKASRRE